MNSTLAIVLLIILAIILFFFLRALIPMFSNAIKNLPKGIFIVMFLTIIGIMAYLVWFLISPEVKGGSTGNSDTKAPTENAEVLEKDAHAIVLSEDRIFINDTEVDMEYVGKYIDKHVESNTPLTIVDDYSSSKLHHEITAMCDQKGVNYSYADE